MVWFLAKHLFDFSPSVVHLTLFLLSFITEKKLSHSNKHSESKNQNINRRMKTKNMPYFIFEKLKSSRMLILECYEED